MSKLKQFVATIDEKIAAGKRTIVVPKDQAVAASEFIGKSLASRSRGGHTGDKSNVGRKIEDTSEKGRKNRERVARHRLK